MIQGKHAMRFAEWHPKNPVAFSSSKPLCSGFLRQFRRFWLGDVECGQILQEKCSVAAGYYHIGLRERAERKMDDAKECIWQEQQEVDQTHVIGLSFHLPISFGLGTPVG